MRRNRLAPLALLILPVALTAALGAERPTAPPPAPAAVTVAALRAASPDSLKYLVRWTVSGDSLGMAESYNLQVTSSKTGATKLVNRNLPGTVDSFTVAKPVYADSVSFTARVVARRRAYTSAAAVAVWTYVRRDQPPPPPGSVTVDSSQVIGARPDSAHVFAVRMYDARTGMPFEVVSMPVGSTMGVVAIATDSLGNVLADRLVRLAVTDTSVVRLSTDTLRSAPAIPSPGAASRLPRRYLVVASR
jgi:hypothetical protein